MKTKAIVLLICIVGALALAAPAMAQSVGSDAYGGGVQGVQSSGGNGDVSSGTGGKAGVQAASNSGGLPFTGLEVGAVLAGGVLLLGTGLVVRRFSSSSDDSHLA